jgi:hypothetical protein
MDEFCGTPCRKNFNNRRATRGTMIYDMFMAIRYDRSAATLLHAWTLMCRMAREFRQEDIQQRESRKSWLSPWAIRQRYARFSAIEVQPPRRKSDDAA